MAGAQFPTQNEAPRATPSPFNADRAPISQGAPIKSAAENHQPIAESFTSEHIDAVSSNEFYIPQDQPETAAVLPNQPASIETVKRGEYHPGYIDQMYAYFDRPKNKEIIDTYTWKTGAVSEKIRYVPNTPPHFSEFARQIGVPTRRLKQWAQKYPEFRDAYEACQEILEEFLIDNGLVGSYGAIAMKFVAVNRSKMKDKVVQENQNVDLNKVLDQIAAGQVRPGGLLPENTGGDY